MLKRHSIVGIFALGFAVLSTGAVFGQNYPNKPIRIISPFGGAGFAARLIADGISAPLGQPVIIENRVAILVPDFGLKAQPDGYTLMVTASFLWTMPLLRKTPYDPVRDFSPVSLVAISPNLLVVPVSLPVKSVKELIDLAKVKPGELNGSIGDIGSGTHLAMELFKTMARINVVSVPYKSPDAETADLIAGRVHFTVGTTGSVGALVKSGKLKVLAVTSAQPSALFPGLPTVAASGLPGYEWTAIYGVFVPAKTPAAIINRLNQEIVRFLHTPEAKEKFINVGLEPIGTSPEELAATIKSDMARSAKLIKDAGIKTE